MASFIKRIVLNHPLVDVTTIRVTADDGFTYLEGFDYEEGFEYELEVQVDPVENPPADGSSLSYTLVEVIDKQSVSSR